MVFIAFTKVWFTLVQTKRRKKKKPGGGDVAYGDLPSLAACLSARPGKQPAYQPVRLPGGCPGPRQPHRQRSLEDGIGL